MGRIFLAIFISSVSAFAGDQVIPLRAVDGLYGGGTFSMNCAVDNGAASCFLDTGLNISYFKSGLFATIPPSLGKAKYTSVTGSQIECDFVALPAIQVGDSARLGPLEPVICPGQEKVGSQNLLGLDAFANRSFTLNAKTSQLILLENSPKLANSFTTDNAGRILLSVQSGYKNPKTVLAMFDSGAAISTVDLELVKAQPENFTVIEKNSAGTDSFGNPIDAYLVIGSVFVGQQKLLAKYFIAMDFSSFQKDSGANIQMILGYNAITKAEWTFNMKQKTWENK